MFLLAVRLRVRIRVGGRVVDCIALLNSGYESDTPQILIPLDLGEELGLWPPPKGAREYIFDTAGGPLRVWLIPRAGYVSVVAEDVESREVLTDIVLSPLADEALIGDVLAGELEIAVEDFARGLWRFRWESRDKLRRSASKWSS